MNPRVTFDGGELKFRTEGSMYSPDGKKVEWGKAIVISIGKKNMALNGAAIRAIWALQEGDADTLHFIDTI